MQKYYNKEQIISISLIDELIDNRQNMIKKHKDKPIKLDLIDKIFKYLLKVNPYVAPPYKIPKNNFEKEGLIYSKPYIKIIYINDIQIIYFNAVKERNLYFKRNFSELNLITNDK